MSLTSEFKAFALKGNVMNLAVGVIIGAAFGKIVDSLVDCPELTLNSCWPTATYWYENCGCAASSASGIDAA